MVRFELNKIFPKCSDQAVWMDAFEIWNGRLDDSVALEEEQNFVWGYGS